MESAPSQPSPGVRRGVVRKLAIVGFAVVLGLALERLLAARLVEIQELSQRSHADMLVARGQLADVMQGCAVAVFGLTAGVGVVAVAAGRRGLRLGVFPPPGVWSWGGPAHTGPRARLGSRVSIGLGLTLVAASAAGGGLLWYMGAVVRACRR